MVPLFHFYFQGNKSFTSLARKALGEQRKTNEGTLSLKLPTMLTILRSWITNLEKIPQNIFFIRRLLISWRLLNFGKI